MDFLGWYTTGDNPDENDIKVHKQICEINESPVFLKVNPLARHSEVRIILMLLPAISFIFNTRFIQVKVFFFLKMSSIFEHFPGKEIYLVKETEIIIYLRSARALSGPWLPLEQAPN